jgi:hypothetical protein
VTFEVEYANGQQGIYVATLNGNRCPLSQGYWKNHQSVWPETSLTLGSQNYTAAELLAILSTSSNGDASLVLARRLPTPTDCSAGSGQAAVRCEEHLGDGPGHAE